MRAGRHRCAKGGAWIKGGLGGLSPRAEAEVLPGGRAQSESWGAGGGRCPKWHHQPQKQAEEPKGPGDNRVQGLGNKEEGKQCALPDFIFLFTMQKKGSGFFFCTKHAPALHAAGAVLQECNPAPPVCMAPAAPPSPAVLHRTTPQATAPFAWGCRAGGIPFPAGGTPLTASAMLG